MHGKQAVEADHVVKLRQHVVEMVHDVVAAVPYMAGVKADTHMVRELHPVEDRPHLGEGLADFRAFAGHGFHQDRGVLRRPKHRVQERRAELDARLRPLSDMAARMEVVVIARRELHATEVVRHRLPGEGPQAVLFCAGIQRIGSVRDEAHDLVFLREREERVHVLRVDFLRLAAARVAGKKGERVRAQFLRFLSHGQVPARGGKMISDMQRFHAAFLSNRFVVAYLL